MFVKQITMPAVFQLLCFERKQAQDQRKPPSTTLLLPKERNELLSEKLHN